MTLTRRALIAAQLDVMTPAEHDYIQKYNAFVGLMNSLHEEWRDKGTWNRKTRRAIPGAWEKLTNTQWWRGQ